MSYAFRVQVPLADIAFSFDNFDCLLDVTVAQDSIEKKFRMKRSEIEELIIGLKSILELDEKMGFSLK